MQTSSFISARRRLGGQRHPPPQGLAVPLQDNHVPNLDNAPPSPTPRRGRAQAGGSLVELVVAVAIIAMMATGLIGSLAYGFLATQLARENQRATQILLEKAEVVRLYNWDQYSYTNDFVPRTFTAVYDPQAATNEQGLTYNGTLALNPFPAGPSYASNMLQITITLNWITAGKVPHSRMLTTQIAKDGLQNYVY